MQLLSLMMASHGLSGLSCPLLLASTLHDDSAGLHPLAPLLETISYYKYESRYSTIPIVSTSKHYCVIP